MKTSGRDSAPFEILYLNGKGPSTLRADAVVDASGTWSTPNPAGANGLEAIGETAHTARITYGMPDVLGGHRLRYANKVAAVLGAEHSAVGTILDLAKLKRDEPPTEKQVRSIIADIAGDSEAAERVELVLPETGVCSRPRTAISESQACCGGPAPPEADACCRQDADAKAAGAKGCGCS